MTTNQIGLRRVAVAGAAGSLLFAGLLSTPTAARGAEFGAAAWRLGSSGVAVQAAAYRTRGRTSQRGPVAATISNGRTQITRFAIGFVARCNTGNSLQSDISTGGVPVRGGRFRATGPINIPLENGMRASGQASSNGRLTRSGTSGTFRLTANVVDSAGATVDTCSTGTVRFTTRR